MFEAAAWVIAFFYGLVPDYSFALAMVAVVVMLLITPLTLKSTKGMLEMQRLQPEMKNMQQQFKGDRQKLNEAMMKLPRTQSQPTCFVFAVVGSNAGVYHHVSRHPRTYISANT